MSLRGPALVLSGGGARGAYQAGVLRGLLDLGVVSSGRSSFPVLVGASAGALNVGALAAFADDFAGGVGTLEGMWRGVPPEQIFRTDALSLSGTGLRWMRDLSLGGLLRRASPKSLLDTGPLRSWLTDHLPLARISEHVQSGALHALAVTATDLYSADGVVFLQAPPDVEPWHRSRWRVERAQIGVEHLLASSAIPVFFPSVAIDGKHYGDGSIRNTAPLSPAIHLGADRIVAVGVRHSGAAVEVRTPDPPPAIAQVAGTLLDAVMLDAVEADIEHAERLNALVSTGPQVEGALRHIDVLWITPSVPIRPIAAEHMDAVPGLVRYLLRGLGDDASTVELASYLLFDASFCARLSDLGRADVHARADEVRAFFARSGLAVV